MVPSNANEGLEHAAYSASGLHLSEEDLAVVCGEVTDKLERGVDSGLFAPVRLASGDGVDRDRERALGVGVRDVVERVDDVEGLRSRAEGRRSVMTMEYVRGQVLNLLDWHRRRVRIELFPS